MIKESLNLHCDHVFVCLVFIVTIKTKHIFPQIIIANSISFLCVCVCVILISLMVILLLLLLFLKI